MILLSKIFKYLLPTLQVGFCTLLRVAVPLLSRYERVHDNVWSIHVCPVLDHICWHTNLDRFTIHPFQPNMRLPHNVSTNFHLHPSPVASSSLLQLLHPTNFQKAQGITLPKTNSFAPENGWLED